jgi:hypothetical protein
MFLIYGFLAINIQFQWSKVSNISAKLPAFKILLDLMVKYSAPQEILNLGISIYIYHSSVIFSCFSIE